ncbi:MAG: DoxX family protein [Planctomycetota bacterium]|jgi:hypothetical protein
MEPLIVGLQAVIALGIINVWILRFGKPSAWRGARATNMREEFAAYGLAPWTVTVIGALKLACAAALIVGIWVPGTAKPAAMALGLLMLGAVLMHGKVKDPPRRSLPAVSLLVACLVLVAV